MNPADPAADSATLRFYAETAPAYHARCQAGINCDLPGWLDRLAPGAEILELGCGAGRDAAEMLRRGFRVELTDGVPEMAALAEERLGRPVRVLRFAELDACARYDGVYASYSLLHVPRAALTQVLQKIWQSLRPGGWHMATYKSGGTAGRDDLGRYFNYLSREQADGYYRRVGAWAVLELTEGQGAGYDGRMSPWVNVVAQKPG